MFKCHPYVWSHRINKDGRDTKDRLHLRLRLFETQLRYGVVDLHDVANYFAPRSHLDNL